MKSASVIVVLLAIPSVALCVSDWDQSVAEVFVVSDEVATTLVGGGCTKEYSDEQTANCDAGTTEYCSTDCSEEEYNYIEEIGSGNQFRDQHTIAWCRVCGHNCTLYAVDSTARTCSS